MKSISRLVVLAVMGIGAISVIPGASTTVHAQSKAIEEGGTKGPFATKQAAINYGVSLGRTYFFHIYEEDGRFFCSYRKRPAGF